MKKLLTIFTSLFVTIICFLFSGCQKYPETLCPCGKIEISKKEYIAMCISPEEVTENSTNILRMENYTKKNMLYDNSFFEYFNGNDWNPIPLDLIAIELILYQLPAGKVGESKANFYYLLTEHANDAKNGKYRFTQSVTLSGFGKYNLVTEFEFIK